MTGPKSSWLFFAIASGACAAFNGVFAKLTTTKLTTTFASTISTLLSLSPTNKFVEIVIRATFFLLNLAFNALMWALFTTALTRATSTTRVSIINTSSNFMLTAFLGFLIFRESLPPLWWVGAAGLVVGNVIIGRREQREEEKNNRKSGVEATARRHGGEEGQQLRESGDEEEERGEGVMEGYVDDEGEDNGEEGIELDGEGIEVLELDERGKLLR